MRKANSGEFDTKCAQVMGQVCRGWWALRAWCGGSRFRGIKATVSSGLASRGCAMPEPVPFPQPNYRRRVPALAVLVRRWSPTSWQSTLQNPSSGERALDVVASDETPDRYGDIITASGWQLANYQKNPVALWLHGRTHPSAQWKARRVEGRQLLGRIRFAAGGNIRSA